MRNVFVAVLILGLGLFGYLLLTKSSPTVPPAIIQQQAFIPNSERLEQAIPLDTDATPYIPEELVKSIYDYDFEYRVRAEAAAENMVSYYDPNSYLRWRAVRLDPGAFLIGDYLQDGAMPKTIQISPFPDTRFTVSETEYKIFKKIEGAIWKGTIDGTEFGRVEINIVPGIGDGPQFVVRIFDVPRSFGISPTETEAGYVAIENNPHQPPSIN